MKELIPGQKYRINNSGEIYTFTAQRDERFIFLNSRGVEEEINPDCITNISKVDDFTIGLKFDGVNKLRWDLVPIEFEEVVKVLTEGAKKYADNNWKYVDSAYNRYYAAARRHMEEFRKAIQNGTPRTDKELGTHVLANAICCLLFLMYMDMHGWENQKNPPTNTHWKGENKNG